MILYKKIGIGVAVVIEVYIYMLFYIIDRHYCEGCCCCLGGRRRRRPTRMRTNGDAGKVATLMWRIAVGLVSSAS